MESQVLPHPPATPVLAVAPPAPRRKTRRERLREELLNAPNLMTLGRILCIPVFLALLAYENRRNSFLAAAVNGHQIRGGGGARLIDDQEVSPPEPESFVVGSAGAVLTRSRRRRCSKSHYRSRR